MRNDQPRALVSDINVTPLVDVMLVLLIIFMVAAPLLDEGISVALPRAVTGQGVGAETVSVTLTKEHLVYFKDAPVTLKELRAQLTKIDRHRPVLIRADQAAYVSRLVELWDLCRDAGFREVQIATVNE